MLGRYRERAIEWNVYISKYVCEHVKTVSYFCIDTHTQFILDEKYQPSDDIAVQAYRVWGTCSNTISFSFSLSHWCCVVFLTGLNWRRQQQQQKVIYALDWIKKCFFLSFLFSHRLTWLIFIYHAAENSIDFALGIIIKIIQPKEEASRTKRGEKTAISHL